MHRLGWLTVLGLARPTSAPALHHQLDLDGEVARRLALFHRVLLLLLCEEQLCVLDRARDGLNALLLHEGLDLVELTLVEVTEFAELGLSLLDQPENSKFELFEAREDAQIDGFSNDQKVDVPPLRLPSDQSPITAANSSTTATTTGPLARELVTAEQFLLA